VYRNEPPLMQAKDVNRYHLHEFLNLVLCCPADRSDFTNVRVTSIMALFDFSTTAGEKERTIAARWTFHSRPPVLKNSDTFGSQ
jgi:hypothetical protein